MNTMENFDKFLLVPAPRWVIPAVTVFLGAFYLLAAFAFGPILTSDGVRDIEYARVLFDLKFDPLAYNVEAELRTGKPLAIPLQFYFYISYIYLLAVLEMVLGGRWLDGLLVINAIAYAIAGALILTVVHRALSSLLSVLLATGLLVLIFDGYQWVAMSQSTAIFMPVATAALYFSIRAASVENGRRWWALAAAMLMIAVFTRPTWPPVVATVIALGLASTMGAASTEGRKRVWAALFAIAAIGGAALIAITAQGYLDPSIIPVGFLREFAEYWRPTYEAGVVVYDRHDTFLTPDVSWWGFARLEIARLGYFFLFLAEDFSSAHRWLNIVVHVPLYGLALVGAFIVIRRPQTLSAAAVTAGLSALMYLLIVDVYHAITFLDYDWRYRAPAYPWIILLAAIGGTTWRRFSPSSSPTLMTMK
jgi:hypothetical protein